MYQLSLFGAATEKLMKATIDGDLQEGVQFVGQSQGVIRDIPSVQELLDRVIGEAVKTHKRIGDDHVVDIHNDEEICGDDSIPQDVFVEHTKTQQHQAMNVATVER